MRIWTDTIYIYIGEKNGLYHKIRDFIGISKQCSLKHKNHMVFIEFNCQNWERAIEKKNNHWIVDHRIDSFMFVIDEWWCDDPLAEQTRVSALLLLALSLNDRMDQRALSVLKTFNTQQINWWRRRRRRRRKKSTKLSFHVRRIFCLIKSDSIQCIEWKIWWMCVVVRCVCVCVAELGIPSNFTFCPKFLSFRSAQLSCQTVQHSRIHSKIVMNGLWCVRSHLLVRVGWFVYVVFLVCFGFN